MSWKVISNTVVCVCKKICQVHEVVAVVTVLSPSGEVDLLLFSVLGKSDELSFRSYVSIAQPNKAYEVTL